MIKSMTGYGGAKGKLEELELTVELKSVNNRYLDVNIRMPRAYSFAEERVKSLISGSVTRGKVDVFVNAGSSGALNAAVKVNAALAESYMAAFAELSESFSLKNDVTVSQLARFPDVLQVERTEVDKDKVSEGLLSLIGEALAEYDVMRSREGERLAEDVLARAAVITELVRVVEEKSPETVAEYRAKLEKRMAEVLQDKNIDEARLLTEAAIFADKSAVDEETVRLRSHLDQLCLMVRGSSPAGRKLDFLVQEMNREANTIGSKCSDASIAHIVVELKSEIEKIREQIQNIE